MSLTSIIEVPAYPDFRRARDAAVERIVDLVNVPTEFVSVLVRRPIEKFLEQVFVMPGSASNHDAVPGGLADHSLAVVIRALEMKENDPAFGNWRDRLALVVVCLLHDVYRTVQALVTNAAKPNDHWEPHNESMLAWVSKRPMTTVSVAWIPQRHSTGEQGIEAVACFELRLWPKGIVPTLGITRCNRIVSALSQSLPRTSPYGDVMKRADHETAKESLLANTTLWINALRKRIQDAAAGWNTPHGEVFFSETHTAIAVPSQGLDHPSTVWRSAQDEVAERLGLSVDPARAVDDLLHLHGVASGVVRSATTDRFLFTTADQSTVVVMLSHATIWGSATPPVQARPLPMHRVAPWVQNHVWTNHLPAIGGFLTGLESIQKPRPHANKRMSASEMAQVEELVRQIHLTVCPPNPRQEQSATTIDLRAALHEIARAVTNGQGALHGTA